MAHSRRTSGISLVLACLLLGMSLVLAGTWISSRDEIRDTREPGRVISTPDPTPALTVEEKAVKPSDSPKKPAETPSSKVERSSPKVAETAGNSLPGLPQRLVVPAIGVNADIQHLGTASDDTQAVPDNYTDVSWWKDGRMPGQNGNAVFAGHTYSGGDGVFDRLSELSGDDFVKVVTSEGSQRYRVRRISNIPLAEYGSVKHSIYKWDGPPGIVLLTCGDWNGKSYESTVVVFAELSS